MGRLSNRDVDDLTQIQYEEALADEEPWAMEAHDVRRWAGDSVTSYEENPCWEGLPDFGESVPEDYDDEDLHVPGMCDYCGSEPWRWPDGEPRKDPFGGKIVCRSCWDQIIGGDDD